MRVWPTTWFCSERYHTIITVLILGMILAFGAVADANAQPQRLVVLILGIPGHATWGDRNSLTNFAELKITLSGAVKERDRAASWTRSTFSGHSGSPTNHYDGLLTALRKLRFDNDPANSRIPFDLLFKIRAD